MKFKIGTVYSRSYSFLSQNAGILIGLTVLCLAVPSFLLSFVPFLQNAVIIPFLSSEALTIATPFSAVPEALLGAFNLAVLTLFLSTRISGADFSLSHILRQGFLYMLPVFILSVIWTVMTSLGIMVMIIPGIIVALGLSVAIQAYICEARKGLVIAVKRSWKLTENYRVDIMFTLIPPLIGLILLSSIESALVSYLDNTLITALARALTSSLGSIILAVFFFFIYTTLRQVKEGHTPEVTAAVFD
ncbi:hypothetical protein [Asticcacaulis tiandongensis]|uniref:hypothetical protein n=1 Tax=Asticcacaulis tiandongensis TaxID=2565365 RepID=UPI0011278CD9|nr:hypothetical protein [Asticcacaulis tiandongensis]